MRSMPLCTVFFSGLKVPPGNRYCLMRSIFGSGMSSSNATAFSPTDTMPLSPRSKLLMLVESMVSLLTVGLVAARAVNILA